MMWFDVVHWITNGVIEPFAFNSSRLEISCCILLGGGINVYQRAHNLPSSTLALSASQ